MSVNELISKCYTIDFLEIRNVEGNTSNNYEDYKNSEVKSYDLEIYSEREFGLTRNKIKMIIWIE